MKLSRHENECGHFNFVVFWGNIAFRGSKNMDLVAF